MEYADICVIEDCPAKHGYAISVRIERDESDVDWFKEFAAPFDTVVWCGQANRWRLMTATLLRRLRPGWITIYPTRDRAEEAAMGILIYYPALMGRLRVLCFHEMGHRD